MLQREMRRELDGSTRAVEKCTAGLAILAMIAVIGAGTAHPGSSAALDLATAHEAAAGYEIRPQPDRR
jgi:hypothetical protein